MTDLVSEQLQETLFELNRVEEREQRLYEENQAILSAISAMSGASNKAEIFDTLLDVIERYIDFDQAVVLSRTQFSDEKFTCLVSTTEHLQKIDWRNGATIKRCIDGHTTVLFAPERTPEFADLCASKELTCRSAVITGLTVNGSESLLILISHNKGRFDVKAKEVLNRFRPLIVRTIIDIDYREKLKSLVTLKTRELSASRRRFRDFAKTASDWFWETDIDNNLSYLSSPSDKIRPIAPNVIMEEIQSQTDLRGLLGSITAKREPISDLEAHLGDGGHIHWVSISGQPVYSEQGEYLGYRGTAKDITDRKQQLAELQAARKQAEEANEAKSRFLAMMSHEIRTPLNAVLGLIDNLQHTVLNSEQIEYISMMDMSAQLLLTIINDVLDLSLIESDNFSLHPDNIDPRDSVTVVHKQILSLANKKGIELNVLIDENVPKLVYQDGNRFTQILLNLVGNAVKFTEVGKVDISLTKDNNELIICISDTGIGITEAGMETIFSPFMQADNSITRRYGGTGLGLAICKKLLDLMDGHIECLSSPGIGSRFKVSIPIVEPVVIENKPGIVVKENQTQPMNILVAEDNKANQMVVKLMLERAGHSVVVAGDGIQVIKEIEKQGCDIGFDLILMDMSMPKLDGIEATRLLRNAGITIPIIALTANAMEEDKMKCLEAGMNDFITKPVRSATIKQVIMDLVHDDPFAVNI
ncbi:hybrid sensor histidine kinase/response regulator [Veronia nyctiphanis]|uniref:histidine kinase n=1 Tax=Veronia nyctiphanis TaxID=1278244 RepID=A0A4Q0YYP2_9GAMM|nr:PAS domain-containing hybrid sensor histidine kinase/response regulator [Veronia nyctiphanis]RXJ74339.1 hybrid sensor histidine kinase/response regulator [Veronia nyctiphanis]